VFIEGNTLPHASLHKAIDAAGFGVEEVGDPPLLCQRGYGNVKVLESFNVNRLPLSDSLSDIGELRDQEIRSEIVLVVTRLKPRHRSEHMVGGADDSPNRGV